MSWCSLFCLCNYIISKSSEETGVGRGPVLALLVIKQTGAEKCLTCVSLYQSIKTGIINSLEWRASKCVCVCTCLFIATCKHQDKISPVLANKSLVCLSGLLHFCRNASLSFKLKLIWGKLLYTEHTRTDPRISIPHHLTSQCCHLFSSYSLFLPLLTSPMGSIIFQIFSPFISVFYQ